MRMDEYKDTKELIEKYFKLSFDKFIDGRKLSFDEDNLIILDENNYSSILQNGTFPLVINTGYIVNGNIVSKIVDLKQLMRDEKLNNILDDRV